jgi:hypothetical protein
MAINKTAAGTFAVDFRDQHKRRIQRTFDTHKQAADLKRMHFRKLPSASM